jgi:hypothetical protein
MRSRTGPWKCRGCGKRGKPKAGFPLFPRAPWKSRHKSARFPHSHGPGDEGGWESGKPKASFPLSHRPDFLRENQEDGGRAIALRRRRRPAPPQV